MSKTYQMRFAVMLLLAVCCASCKQDAKNDSKETPSPGQELTMSDATTLENLLNAGNWAAADLAAKHGAAALPVVKKAATSKKSETRQIAMASAGKIGGADAAKVLGAALSDEDINVRLQAANELSSNPPQQAGPFITARLAVEEDLRVKEALAMGAGYIPGNATLNVLKPISMGTDSVAVTARMALAKLGDKVARQTVASELASPDAFKRYSALGWLRYINDKVFVPDARKLLYDKANAQKIGPVRQPVFRRVCDQAVDTVIYLMKLKVPFENHVEKIYSDAEINTVAKMVP